MRRSPLSPPARSVETAIQVWLVAALVLALVVVELPPARNGPTPISPLAPALAGPCLGAAAPSPATGTLVLVGSSSPLPSLSGVPVRVNYFYTEENRLANESTETCIPTNATGATGAGGAISVPLPIPADRCNPPACVDYFGPFGPLGYATDGAPAGFFERDPTNGTSPGQIDWDADLYGAALNQTGTDVVSVNAFVPLSVSSWNALGAPVPGTVTYTWTISGLKWSVSNPTGSTNTVQGTDSGWVGSLSVTANATYGTTVESVTTPVLSLLPVQTEVLSATASPTPVDPGVPVTFDVTGSGAAGYDYSVTVDPGLGAGSVSGPCTSTRLPNGSATIDCSVRAAYPASGFAAPVASLSNGYSTGQLAVGSVAVHPVEEVSLSASTPVAYANRTLEFTVNVTNGTGSAPYGPACLSPGNGASLACQFENGSSWQFEESYATPGTYTVRASVTDHFGENVSASAAVIVVAALAARANGSSVVRAVANESTALSAIVTGGVFPISTEWNLSRPAHLLCTFDIAFDGPISCEFATAFLGLANVTLTLRDAFGSVTTVVFRLNVTGPPPTGSSSPSRSAEAVLVGALGAVAVVALLLALVVRRRARSRSAQVVEELELERMARGRDHLLSRADPVTAHRPDELTEGWTGPPVAPEEWAEWIAALVTDGSLLPVRGPDHRLAYRRAAPRPSTPTIQFDPAVWTAHRASREEEPEPPEDPDPRQDGG